IRCGSASKAIEKLFGLLHSPYVERTMLCCDDIHASDLQKKGHIDNIIRTAIDLGVDPIKAIKAGSLNAALHYQLNDMGAIAPSYLANLIVVDSIKKFQIKDVYLNGKHVAHQYKLTDSQPKFEHSNPAKYKPILNSFNMKNLTLKDITPKEFGNKQRVIGLIEKAILSEELICDIKEEDNLPLGVSLEKDIAKFINCERHNNTGHVAIAFVHNYGIKRGAIASSVAHDCHHLSVIGVNDEDILLAANTVIKNKGGYAIALDGKVLEALPLEIAGLMTNAPSDVVIFKLSNIEKLAHNKLGINKNLDPLMTLAFCSLAVIPKLKLTTKGLVDVEKHEIVPSIF
ncbi:MAG: amidohydrolase family protein, partial [Clostridia bacterium]|nr:amidohydrolase family protein [Clostridia bacterium]